MEFYKNIFLNDYYDKNWKNYFYQSKLFELPAYDFHNIVLSYFINEKVFNEQAKVEKSDEIDLLHISYLPHFDAIQVDKRKKDLINKIEDALDIF